MQRLPATSYFFEDLLGFRSGLLRGVSLLSRRRLSTSPVDFAVGLGPGLSGMAYSSMLKLKVDVAADLLATANVQQP